MRIWIDITAPAHPLFFRPVVERLRSAGHEVEITARDYAQTLQLLERLGMPCTTFGHHAGASRAEKAAQLVSRTRALRRFGRDRRFDLALAHGSNDMALAARSLGIPAANTFDYEFAVQQHNIGCRMARRVMVPESIPPDRLRRYGVGPDKLVQYPGLKEEYYLHDFEPDPAALEQLGIDRSNVLLVLRPPPDVSLYHRKANPLFGQLLQRVGSEENLRAVVLPRTDDQREQVRSLGLPSLVVPDRAVDAQSLIAFADLVISAGGTINREAVALGTPVYTTFAGKMGGVDEMLIREKRLRPLTDPGEIQLVKHSDQAAPVRRDPSLLVDLLLGTPR